MLLTPIETIKSIESGKKILVAHKGQSDWKELEITPTGFALNFVQYDYKLK